MTSDPIAPPVNVRDCKTRIRDGTLRECHSVYKALLFLYSCPFLSFILRDSCPRIRLLQVSYLRTILYLHSSHMKAFLRRIASTRTQLSSMVCLDHRSIQFKRCFAQTVISSTDSNTHAPVRSNALSISLCDWPTLKCALRCLSFPFLPFFCTRSQYHISICLLRSSTSLDMRFTGPLVVATAWLLSTLAIAVSLPMVDSSNPALERREASKTTVSEVRARQVDTAGLRKRLAKRASSPSEDCPAL